MEEFLGLTLRDRHCTHVWAEERRVAGVGTVIEASFISIL